MKNTDAQPLQSVKPNNVDAYRRLIDQLVQTRKAIGMSQSELGRLLSKPQSHISKVESRERKLGLVEFVHWTRTLGAKPSELFVAMESDLVPLPSGIHRKARPRAKVNSADR